jgi:hypothetical protein
MPLLQATPALGQTGILLRRLLAEGRGEEAAALVPRLDPAHRIELLLGAALRDRRENFRGAALYLACEDGAVPWEELCIWLGQPADYSLDELAASYIAEGRAPEKWLPTGLPPSSSPRALPFPDLSVAAQLQAGVSGLDLLDTFSDVSLYPAVSHYYRKGSIFALGPRPLLSLAAVSIECI